MSSLTRLPDPSSPEQTASYEARTRWPWKGDLALPALNACRTAIQTFMRLDMGPHPDHTLIYLNGQIVAVPIAQDPITLRYVAMLPVPSPTVTVTESGQMDVASGIYCTRFDVQTEGGAPE